MTKEAQTAAVLERLQRLGDQVEDRLPGMKANRVQAFLTALKLVEDLIDRREVER